VACVNVANLALVRATGRVHEFAIRAALGSGRARLAGQLLVESLLLAAMGGVLGVVVALSVVSALRRFAPDALPRLGASGLDTAVLAFAAIVTMTSAVVFGVAPALRLARADPTHALREQSRTATGSRAQARLRSGLVVAQLAAALALSSGACVLFASVHRLQTLDLGFRTDRVLTFEINLPTVRYDPARRAAFQEELSRRLQGIPGVTAAGATSRLPGTGSYHPWSARIDSGRLAGTSISRTSGFPMQNRTVSGDYFRALDIPLLAGRTFDERDEMTRSGAPMRAIVSANFARHAFPGVPLEQVVGQRVSTIIRPREREIIGVVGDVAMDALGTPALVLYHPHRQFAANRNWALTHVVSSEIPAERLIPAVRAAIASLDAELVMHQPAPLDEVVGRGIRRERFAAILMLAFAGVTLLLAALGLYGVIAYTVRERAQEIGIRMALGASAAQVRGLILRQAARVVGAGLALGLGAAVALGRWVASLAIEISPTDPRILGAMAALLAVVGLVSAWVPARRAGDGIIGVSPRP
jgi:predicted permease